MNCPVDGHLGEHQRIRTLFGGMNSPSWLLMPRAACQDRRSLTADAPWRPHNGSGPSRPGQDMTDQIAVENNQFIDYTFKCNINYILCMYIIYNVHPGLITPPL